MRNKDFIELAQAYDHINESYESTVQHTQGVDPTDTQGVKEQETSFDPREHNSQQRAIELEEILHVAEQGYAAASQLINSHVQQLRSGDHTMLGEDEQQQQLNHAIDVLTSLRQFST